MKRIPAPFRLVTAILLVGLILYGNLRGPGYFDPWFAALAAAEMAIFILTGGAAPDSLPAQAHLAMVLLTWSVAAVLTPQESLAINIMQWGFAVLASIGFRRGVRWLASWARSQIRDGPFGL